MPEAAVIQLVQVCRCGVCGDQEYGPWGRCAGCGLLLCEACQESDLATLLDLCREATGA